MTRWPVPGLAGLLLTFAVNFADLQVSFSFPSENTADVPLARPAFSTAPDLTAVPPVFLIVSTWPAANADVAGRATTAAEVATAAR